VCEQSIRDRAGKVWTGRLVDHLGNNLAEIDVDGVRHIGRKVNLAAARTAFIDFTDQLAPYLGGKDGRR
jgi:hypothetical protein